MFIPIPFFILLLILLLSSSGIIPPQKGGMGGKSKCYSCEAQDPSRRYPGKCYSCGD
jgi:hypothetical protein